jgi:threonine/homoserine/homoserine lactone efflux protein
MMRGIVSSFLSPGCVAMPAVPTLLTFAVAALLLIVVPGPNVLFIISRGIEQGRRAAVTSAMGVETGMLVHTAAATLGLSALVASSDLVFSIVKYAGAAYLVWMGIQSMRSRPDPLQLEGARGRLSLRRLYLQGLVINVLNPKVGLFFLAFLPQFVDSERGSSAAQIMVFGAVFFVIATISDLSYALASGSIGSWLGTREWVSRQRNRFSGMIYIGLGALAAMSGSARQP